MRGIDFGVLELPADVSEESVVPVDADGRGSRLVKTPLPPGA
jgi:hypothetical protein